MTFIFFDTVLTLFKYFVLTFQILIFQNIVIILKLIKLHYVTCSSIPSPIKTLSELRQKCSTEREDFHRAVA